VFDRVSIARASLRHEARRYLPAILSVTFAGLLMLVQVALLQGLFATVSAPIDRSTAELWIGHPGVPSVDLGRPVNRHAEALARVHPEVARVEPMASTAGDLRRADGVALGVFVHVVDTAPGALGFARLLTPAQRALLDEPDAVLIDRADLDKLGGVVGQLVEINGRRARVAGLVEGGLRGIGGLTLMASFATAQRFDPTLRRDEPQYLLVGLRPGANAARVAAELADLGAHPRWQVYRADEFSGQSQRYWLLESGMGLGALFGVLLALVVGVVITSQTLAAAISASIKEFAALRALGVSVRALRGVVLQLSLWIAGAGLMLTAECTAALLWLAHSQHVAMEVSPALVAGTVALVLVITTASGLLALRPLFNTEPASLLR
jgi:putative ABC transport system permease protein